ncbi:unnamed protein product [Alternaria alternata]
MPLLYGEGEEKARKRLEKNVRELQDEEMDAQGYHSGDELGSSAFSGGYKAHARLLNVRSMGTLKRRRKSYDNGFGESQSRATIAALFRKAASNHSNLVLLNPWHQALCLPRNIASGSDARSIFRGAHASFLNAVYWDEWPRFETFVDRQEMMADIRGHFQSFKHSSRLMTASEVVDDFSSRLAHFFTAVSFGIEVDPEWSRTLWGAIRLMFVRSLNFPNLFERLAHLLGRIRQELPSYQDYVGRLQADPRGLDKEALGKALAFVYADIVSFCRDACRFFSTPFSNLEHTHDPIMNVLSIPFNLRFESLIARLNEHKLLFAIELRAGKHESLNIFVENVIEDLRKREEYFQSRSTMERLERERDECHSKRPENYHPRFHVSLLITKGANFTAGVRWILPPEFRAEFDRAKKARSPGSCAWLQSLKAYTMWKESLLTDDTILSTAMIEDLQSPLSSVEMKDNEVPHASIIYFHFNAQKPGQRSFCDALRAATAQVVETLAENSAIMDLLSVLKLQTDGSRRIATEQELSEFLLLAVRSLPSVALIFDAIDECHDVEKMWPFLSAVCTTTNMKFLLLGRPQIPVHPDVAHLILREELPRTNRLDIYDFLVREIKSMQNRGQLDDRTSVDLKDAVADYQVLQMTEGFPVLRHFSVYLDSEDLLEVELAAKDQKFTFPVSFASDMSQISILRSLYWVDGLGTVISQKVGLNPALHNNNQDVAAELRLPRPSATRTMYRRLFTPCGRYLAHLERQNDFNDSSEGLWTFGIWEKEASDILFMGGSAWRQIATLDDVYGDFLIDGDVTLNPQYQMIALMKFVPYSLGKKNITSIWDFRAIPFGSCNDEKTTKTDYHEGELMRMPTLSGEHLQMLEN